MPKPFTFYGGFTDKTMEARYRAQPLLARHTTLSSWLILIATCVVLANNGAMLHSKKRAYANAFAILVACSIVFIANSVPHSQRAITATTTGYIMCMVCAPFYAQQTWAVVLASLVLAFCPIDALTPARRTFVYAVHYGLVVMLYTIRFYPEIQITISNEMPPLQALYSEFVVITIAVCFSISNDVLLRKRFAHAELLIAAQDVGAGLLAHLLPPSLLQRLASGDALTDLTSENDDVAVLVADIVEFTSICAAAATPVIAFKLLNSAFSEFERVAHAEGAFKVKTIGDCIVFTAGLRDFPGPARDRKARVTLLARVACDMHIAAAHLSLRVRIGIHVGSLISGVMNSRGFVFDVWGEGIRHACAAEAAAPPGGTAFTADAAVEVDSEIAAKLTPMTTGAGGADSIRVSFFTLYEEPVASVSVLAARAGGHGAPISPLARGMSSRTFARPQENFGLRSWSWDVFRATDRAKLPSVALELLLPSLACGLVSDVAAAAVTTKLCAAYSAANPFHNAHHGVATMQVLMMLARYVPAIKASLADFDVFLLAIAALGHDAGHPGLNGAYQIMLRTPIALAHGFDGPVLERYHAAITIGILEESNALSLLAPGARVAARRTVVAAIMASDWSRHDAVVNDLTRSRALATLTLDALYGALVHCADHSAHIFPRAVSVAWTVRISEEFTNQIKAEKLHGLPQSPDLIGLESPLSRARMQASFLKHSAAPLWRALSAFAGGNTLDEPIRNLEDNQRYYDAEIVRLSAADTPGAFCVVACCGRVNRLPSAPAPPV